jgi:hypothetical protein
VHPLVLYEAHRASLRIHRQDHFVLSPILLMVFKRNNLLFYQRILRLVLTPL